MKVLSARVTEWKRKPEFELQINRLDNHNHMVYEKRGDLYFAESGGYVHFYAHNPRNESGYGGSKFKLTLTDGSVVELKGPWSSRPGVMNAAGFKPCISVVLIDASGTKYGGAITVELAKQLLDRYKLPYKLVQVVDDNDIRFDLTKL